MPRQGMRVLTAPSEGIYRVGPQPDPVTLRETTAADLSDHRAGNRFDSFLGNYEVIYFATDLVTCFEETLTRLVPRPDLADLVHDEWLEKHFMHPGSVPREWRNDRRIAHVLPPADAEFVDVDHADTLATLEQLARPVLLTMGVEELDTATIRNVDRRVTRLISQLIWAIRDEQEQGAYAGIRYASRVNGGECWALFADRVGLETVQVRVIYQGDEALQQVAQRRNLTIH